MSKYIELDKAEIIFEHILETDTRTFFDRGDELTDRVYSSVAKGLETLKSLPAADVVEVVRCKDCIMWDNSFVLNGKNKCLNIGVCTNGDFYCGWGE